MRSPGLLLTAALALFAGITVAHEDAPDNHHKTSNNPNKSPKQPPAIPPSGGTKPGSQSGNEAKGGCFTLSMKAFNSKYKVYLSGLLVMSRKEAGEGNYLLVRQNDDPNAPVPVFQLNKDNGATVKTEGGSLLLAYCPHPGMEDVLTEVYLTPTIGSGEHVATVEPNLAKPAGFSFGADIGKPVVCLSGQNYIWLGASKHINDPRVKDSCAVAEVTAQEVDCTADTATPAASTPNKKKGSAKQPPPPPPKA